MNIGKIVYYTTRAIKLFLTSVSLQHEPKASVAITRVRKTFIARVAYDVLFHKVRKRRF